MATRGPTEQPGLQIDFLRLHLSVWWNTFLVPFEQSRLATLLPDLGYMLDERFRAARAGGLMVEFTGTIARKGTTSLTMNTGKPTLGVEATNGQALVEELDSIEQMLGDGFSFDSQKHAFFYEVLAQALVWTKTDALAVLRGLGTTEAVASSFSEKTGLGPAANVSLRLVPTEGEMHSADWWEVNVEPSSRSPHQCYSVLLVYRNPDRSKVIELAKNIGRVVTQAIEVLERHHE